MALLYPPTLTPKPKPPPSLLLRCHRPSLILPLNHKPHHRPPTATITCSSSSPPKIVRCPSLDRHASAHHRLRFVRKLTTLLLSKPRHFLSLRLLSVRCRPYLSLPPGRPLLPMILRYPAIFRLFHAPSSNPLSASRALLSVSLTPAAESLFADAARLCNSSSLLADKLRRLLMLASPHPRLLLSKLVHIAPDLGLPPNFRSRLCNSHPDLFRTVDTSYGRALELVSWDDSLAVKVALPNVPNKEDWRSQPIIDRPPKFKKVRLRRGLNVKRRHLDYLVRFQEIPEINPYVMTKLDLENAGPEEKEKRACEVVREVLGMTMEKRTLVDHLTHFRKEFGLPNRLRAMLIRHPEMFYVSVKGERDSVFLVEAYDDKGRLLAEDELLVVKKRLGELVREGKRMRRATRRGVGLNSDEKDDKDSEEDEEVEGFFEDDDGLGDLFESGIGDDWEEFGDEEGGSVDDADKEIIEFWSLNSEISGTDVGEGSLNAW